MMLYDVNRKWRVISRYGIMLGLITFFGTACVKRKATPTGPEAPTITKPIEQETESRPGEVTTSVVESPSIASLPIALDEAQLKKHVSYTNALRYRFSYAERKVEDDIKFDAGKALITIKKLRSGVTADLILEVVEDGAVRLRGVAKDLKLEPKENRIPLSLSPVNGDSGDLSINIDVPSDPGVVPVDPIQGDDDTLIGGGAGSGTGSPAFESEIRPIFARHCAECHHPGAQTPDLTAPPNSRDVEAIISQIENKEMPPAPRDGVSEQDLNKIKSWKTSLD